MPARDSLVGQLLTYAAAPAEQRDGLAHWRLADIDEREFRWLLDAGLGPLLHHATRMRPEQVPSAWRERLLSAELTARMRHADRVDTACEVIDLCAREGVPVTLLKGISVSEQFYPVAHLRPMADIDLLVPPECCRPVQRMLEDAGYRRTDDYPDANEQHHGPPLVHPVLDVYIEIHRDLFPQRDELSESRLFDSKSTAANSEPYMFHGLPALRLRAEFQLMYIASSWMRDLMHSSIHPTFLASIFDAIFLLENRRGSLDWPTIVGVVGDNLPTSSLHVLMTYIASRGQGDISYPIGEVLARQQSLVGPLQLHIIHSMLDRYLIAGRSWRHVLPPPVAGRYNVHRQWLKRVLRRPYGRSA